MKKYLMLILALGLILMLVACGESEPYDDYNDVVDVLAQLPEVTPEPADDDDTTNYNQEDNEGETYEPEPEMTEFTFLFGSVLIYMDQNMDDLLPQLGEPLGVFEQPSCAFDGIDRVFAFPGIEIHTYPDGDQDFVHTINVRDDSVTTINGIYLGSSWADVLAAYGDVYTQDARMFTFTLGETSLSFFVEDDMVIGINYNLIFD